MAQGTGIEQALTVPDPQTFEAKLIVFLRQIDWRANSVVNGFA